MLAQYSKNTQTIFVGSGTILQVHTVNIVLWGIGTTLEVNIVYDMILLGVDTT